MELVILRQTIVFDVSNIGYICAHRLSKGFEDEENSSMFLMNQIEAYMRQIYRNLKIRADKDSDQDIKHKVIFACDSEDNKYWRMELFPEYKQNRPMTNLRQAVRDAISLFLKWRYSH